MKKKSKAKPYVKWIHPKDDFSIPEGYSCVPSAIGHLDEPWAIFRTPRTPEEMETAITIEEDRFKDEMEYLAYGGKVSAETRVKLLLGISLRHIKSIGELYERKGELKFSAGIADIKCMIGNEFSIWRTYIQRLTKWNKGNNLKNPPRPPKLAAKIRETFIKRWNEYKESVKGVSHPTVEEFFESDWMLKPIENDDHSLAEYYRTVDAIKAELHAMNQNRRNANKKASAKRKKPAKSIGKATQKQKSRH